MPLHMYHPEMGEKIDTTKITTHASLGHYGKHYFVTSTLGPDKIRGVGVKYLGRYAGLEPDVLKLELQCSADHKYLGYYHYKLTEKAFEKLQKTVEIGYEMLLD